MTTPVVVLPDVEQLVVDFLLDQSEIDAIADDHVVTELPKDKPDYMVRVHQFNTLRQGGDGRHIATAVLQIEAYGGAKKTAKTLLETCFGTMHARMVGVHDEGVVTGVSQAYGLRSEPDTTFQPARPRWLGIIEVTVHP